MAPKYVFHFIQDRYLVPSFVVDITDVFEGKMESISCFNCNSIRGCGGGR
jgi:hypothetical protein